MTTEEPEQSARDAADEMARDAEQMEQKIDDLDESIDDAEKAAAQRPEADSDLLGDVAGDWEEEAEGAQQGEDAVDAARENPDKADAGESGGREGGGETESD